MRYFVNTGVWRKLVNIILIKTAQGCSTGRLEHPIVILFSQMTIGSIEQLFINNGSTCMGLWSLPCWLNRRDLSLTTIPSVPCLPVNGPFAWLLEVFCTCVFTDLHSVAFEGSSVLDFLAVLFLFREDFPFELTCTYSSASQCFHIFNSQHAKPSNFATLLLLIFSE